MTVDVRACCVCHSVYRPHREEWIQVGEPIYKLIMEEYNVSHGYCPPCMGQAMDEFYKKTRDYLKENEGGLEASVGNFRNLD